MRSIARPAVGLRLRASSIRAVRPAAGVGQLRAIHRLTPEHPHRAVRHRSVPVDYAQTRRRPGPIGGDPGHRPPATGSACWWSTRAGPARRPLTPSPAWARRWPTPTSCAASTWSGVDPRGVGHSTPRTALPHRRRVRRVSTRSDGRLQPRRRRAHRAASTASSRSAAPNGWARSSWPTSGPRRRHATWTSCARRSARTRSTIWASPTAPSSGAAYAEHTATGCGRMVLDGARRPTSIRSPQHPPEWRVSKRRSTPTRPTARSRRAARSAPIPAQFVDRYHQLVDPLVQQAGRDLRSARPELPGRDHRHRQRALHPALLAVPHQRAAGPAARHRRRRPAAAGRRLPAPRRTGHYKNLQDAFTAIRCVDAPYPTDPAGVGRRRSDRSREAAPFLAYGYLHRVRPARRVRDVAGAADVDSAPATLTRPRQGRRGLHHARPGHPVQAGRGPGPSDGRAR